MNETAHKAADRLARTMRDQPWYHRTSVRWLAGMGSRIVVWGEGPRPASLPTNFEGFAVCYNRVSARHSCPFGSVKGLP